MSKNTAIATFRELPDLSVEDHTRIVEGIMENPIRVIRHLDLNTLISRGERPSSTEVLEAALKVSTIEEGTKHSIRKVLEVLPVLEEASRLSIPRSTQRQMREVFGRALGEEAAVEGAALARARFRTTLPTEPMQTRPEGMPALADVYASLKALQAHRAVAGHESLVTGIAVATNILDVGLDTIYSPASDFYRMLTEEEEPSAIAGEGDTGKSAGEHAKDVAKADITGAVEGGVAGCVAGAATTGPGAPGGCVAGAGIGAAAGAAGSSAAEVVDKVLDWLF